MSTGITGSQPRFGDPSGAGTLTQRLSVTKPIDLRIEQEGSRRDAVHD
jgi:hypothetical protein